MRSWRSLTVGGLSLVITLLVIALVAPRAPQARAQPQSPADLALINGRVLTVDSAETIAQAVAIAGGKIVAVGPNDLIRARIGATTDVVDLNGRAVTPGLIDTHVHFSEAAALFTIDLSDPAINSMDQVRQRVAARVATAKPGEWVTGNGWDEGKLLERRYVLAADLDKVSPNNPVWLEHTTGHYGVANSYALKLAEVRKETNDPPAGTIDRVQRAVRPASGRNRRPGW
jgi:predicted amidohydrolase YtcJ